MKNVFIPDDFKGEAKDTSDLHFIYKGGRIEKFDGAGDGYLIEYDDASGFICYCLLNNITTEELNAFSVNSSFEIAFTEINKCGMVCLKFGSMPWGDACFEPCLYQKYEFPNVENNMGIAFTIVVVEPNNGGVIKSIRTIGLGHEFSRKFIEWCVSHYNEKTTFDKKTYMNNLNALFARYSSRELANMAFFRWKLKNIGNGNERNVKDR